MELYELSPEVAGGFGPATVITNQDRIASGDDVIHNVSFLEYRFDSWMGDDLITFLSCFLVTERLADALDASGLSGYRFERASLITSDIWGEFAKVWEKETGLPPSLPNFVRLIPRGSVELMDDHVILWSGDNVCFGVRTRRSLNAIPWYGLVMTSAALEIVQRFHINHCDVKLLKSGLTHSQSL